MLDKHISEDSCILILKNSELEFFVEKFNFIGLGNDKRFEIFKNLLADKDFEIYFDFYLKILGSDFRIGINNNSTYLKHRVYSDGTFRPPVDQINKVMNQKILFYLVNKFFL